MKVSIITYHYSSNNGAVMQTYALCRYLRELGHDLEIIDIRQDESGGIPFFVKIIKYFIFGYRINQIVKKFYPKLTRKYNSLDELQADPPISDIYIVGSDQVWNPDISKELALAYFLDFGGSSVKRVSYASSFGKSEWTIDDSNLNLKICKLLSEFMYLSVREKEGKLLCEKQFGISPEVVLDPTFLNYDYLEFNKGVKQSDELVCYKLNRTDDFWKNIKLVGKKLGVKPTLLNYNYPKFGLKYCFPPSLRTWMRKIAGAKFIVTDSFHGIAFSIINRKQFAVILNDDGKNSRLVNLMRIMNLESRVFPSVKSMVEDDSWMEPIDYSILEPNIKRLVEHSRNFLKDALK